MKILVFGSTGQVGSELSSALLDGLSDFGDSLIVEVIKRKDIDLADFKLIRRFLEQKAPDYVVNASAYTAVDKAESEQSLAYVVNLKATHEIATYCSEAGCPLVHISTDYVFNGETERPYLETDHVDPIGVYGKSKLAGENCIREILTQHIILRTSWVFGINGHNFVKTMIRLCESKDKVSIVSDQLGAPTSARAIARAIAEIISQMVNALESDARWGTYHFSGHPFTSWADFADEIFKQADQHDLIKRRPKLQYVSTEEYPTTAARPKNSSLDCSKLKRTFDIDPDNWRESLNVMLSEIVKAKMQ